MSTTCRELSSLTCNIHASKNTSTIRLGSTTTRSPSFSTDPPQTVQGVAESPSHHTDLGHYFANGVWSVDNFDIMLVALTMLQKHPSMSLSMFTTRLQSWDSTGFVSIPTNYWIYASDISVGNTRFYVLPSIVTLGIPRLLRNNGKPCIAASSKYVRPFAWTSIVFRRTRRIHDIVLTTLRTEHSIVVEDLQSRPESGTSSVGGHLPCGSAGGYRQKCIHTTHKPFIGPTIPMQRRFPRF